MKCSKCSKEATIEFAVDWVGGSIAFAEFTPFCDEHNPTSHWTYYARGLAVSSGQLREISDLKENDKWTQDNGR